MSTSVPYAPSWRRAVAVLIDYAIAFWIVLAVEEAGRSDAATAIGAVLAASYFLAKDALLRGKSIGKLLIGLHVVRREDLGPISAWTSMKRNSPPFLLLAVAVAVSFALALVLAPKIAGKAAGGAILAGLLYIYRGADSEDHSTLGDSWAGTLVVKRWKWANKAPEPTPTSVTSPAAQEPRQP